MQEFSVYERSWADRLAARDMIGLPYLPTDVPQDGGLQSLLRRQLNPAPFRASDPSADFLTQVVAAISLYLGRLSGKDAFDVDFKGLTIGRLSREAAAQFASTVPLRVRLTWQGSFADHVRSTAEAVRETEQLGSYPQDLVSRSPQISAEQREKLRGLPDVVLAIVPDAAGGPVEPPPAQLAILIKPSEKSVELVANSHVINKPLLAKIGDELEHVLAQVRENSQALLGEISVVAPHEQAALQRLNDQTRVVFDFRSLPEMFRAQVERTPDAIAIVFHGTRITYREFDAYSNQLANLLIARGVAKGDLVGVLMDRSIEMMIGLYAVLKAGAAYVPMDPAYPAHRLEIMAEDAEPKIILTETERAAQLAAFKAQILVVDRKTTFDGLSTSPPAVSIDPDDLAYVIYTSGSTGRPKGVMITHKNVRNLFLSLDDKLNGVVPGTWLALISISFDVSIPEIFWTLARGATVVLRGSEKASPKAISQDQPARTTTFSLIVRDGSDRGPESLCTRVSEFAEQHGFAILPELDAKNAARSPGKSDAVPVKAEDDPETFRRAAEIGAPVLTRATGQPLETLAQNIALYRKVWRETGHSGEGRVTVLLPTLIGADDAAVKQAVRGPMTAYLKNEIALIREAVWDYPAFQQKSEEGVTPDAFLADISGNEFCDLLEFSFERNYATGGLFGSRARCQAIIERLNELGVDEIACLLDFGLPTEPILEHLPDLNELKVAVNGETSDDQTDDVATLIERHDVTHLQCTPARASALMWDPRARQALARLKVMIVGGEAMSVELARQLRSTVSGRIFNIYGPTETTVWSTMHLLDDVGGPVPIGKPTPNTQLYVTDERLKPLPIGVPGELLIGGDSVGRGYLKRPELTESRFLKTQQGTVYRTGDLVRLRPDGVLEFLGRLDDQVKIRGFRIELGEIEAVLETHPAIRKAVVHPQDDASGGKRLVAYIVPRSENVRLEAIRQFVCERLPDFMVPSHYESMSELPLTPSGKVDRRALPKPSVDQRRESVPQVRTPPQTETERQLAELWQSLLEAGAIDRSDNFFELGGHSLLAMRAASQINEKFGVRMAPKSLLICTLAQLAAEIDESKGVQPTAVEDRPSTIAASLLKRFPRFLTGRLA
jgi:non-ribosomal peptide synthetase component F